MIGTSLADALPQFSLDLVGLTASFVMYQTAVANAAPQPLLDIKFKDSSFFLACPDDETMWCAASGYLAVYSLQGVLIRRAFEDQCPSPKCGIAFDRNGKVYCYTGNRVLVGYVSDGKCCDTIPLTGSSYEYIDGGGLACKYNPADTLFILRQHHNNVLVVRTDGVVVREIGKASAFDDGLKDPRAVAVDENGLLFVSDMKNRVKVGFGNDYYS